MCGIAGIVSRTEEFGRLSARLQRMTNALRHRGPDGCGLRLFQGEHSPRSAGLGHRRLAIIDLSNAGLQPMSNEDGTVWVVFNGEIYNFRELRSGLMTKGHQFRSATDTEVLVHLYEEHGDELVRLLNGMFAFAILDLKRQRILLARDQLGIKPLFYTLADDGFGFASEIKGLLVARDSQPTVDWQAVYDYFTYLYVPHPATIFREIRQLSPAHILSYDMRSGEHRVTEYWRVRRRDEIARSSVHDIEQRLISQLQDAVSRQLVSDVPLGLFLSGGIDSSVLASLAANTGVTPRTYTVNFPGPATRYYSESAIAADTSRMLKTEHRQLDVHVVDPFEMLSLIDHFDEPFGNPTFYLQWLIARSAREHITVALNGAGGDELFAGYPRYRAAQLSRWARRVPQSLLRLTSRALEHLRDTQRTMSLRRMREFLGGMDSDPVREFTQWTYFMRTEDKAQLLKIDRDFESSDRFVRQLYDESAFEDLNRLLETDVRSFLVDNLLTYTDRMSMAVGMEIRVPLLEPGFVEYALNIPFRLKLKATAGKWIMRDAFAPFLTSRVRNGAKRGFNAPLAAWMRRELDEYFVASKQDRHPLKDTLGADIGATWTTDGILDASYIESLRQRHRQGSEDLSHELFAVIAFDVWWRKYVAQTLPVNRWSDAT